MIFRGFEDDLAATPMDEGVSGAAAEALHALVDPEVLSRDRDLDAHMLEIEGKL
jgi:hypothetical protein